MKIVLGSDWKSTAAGYSGVIGTFSASLTALLIALAVQDPKHNWIWVFLSSVVTCAVNAFRIWIGTSQNYLQTPPPPPANLPTVEVTTVPAVTAKPVTK